jgi:ankyrin repeat protein
MVSLGLRDRLAELLGAEPELVNQVHLRIGTTPLFWLPGEDAAALDMARFLLERGADPSARDREGHTPGELARLHGREALADLLAGGK